MKKLKIIIITLLNCINIYLLYSTVGYLILAIKTPKITGDTPTTVMGMYIMSITFGAIFLMYHLDLNGHLLNNKLIKFYSFF